METFPGRVRFLRRNLRAQFGQTVSPFVAGTNFALIPFTRSGSGVGTVEPNNEKERVRHALAAEDALLILVDRLAMRGTISVDEGIDILQVLSRSSEISAASVSRSLNLLSQLRRLRRGDGEIAPGAPATGPLLG
jgi:hypothetical protein